MYSRSPCVFLVMLVVYHDFRASAIGVILRHGCENHRTVWRNFSIWTVADVGLYKKPMLYQSNRMHDAVVSKLIAASRGSPCDSMASCLYLYIFWGVCECCKPWRPSAYSLYRFVLLFIVFHTCLSNILTIMSHKNVTRILHYGQLSLLHCSASVDSSLACHAQLYEIVV